MHIFKHTNYDFLRWRVPALVLSWVIILGGLAVIGLKGLPLGIEFSGGTVVVLKFQQACPRFRPSGTRSTPRCPARGRTP